MTAISLDVSPSKTELDVCKSCRFIWFDRNEFQRLPAQPGAPHEQPLSLEARKAVALAQIEAMKESQDQAIADDGPPDTWWQFGLGVLGIPVEYGTHNIRSLPLLTWTIAVLMVLLTLASLPEGSTLLQDWALIPNQFSRHFGLTFFSSFLIHGGIAHLLSNLYFLLVCGDDVEDVLGPGLLALIFSAALVGDVAHILIDPHASTPVVGASGGISGVMAYYCLRFPKARVGFMWWFRWYRVRVGWIFMFWIVGQVIGAVQQIGGFSSVSSLAHLGGALAGVAFRWLEPELRQEVGVVVR